MLYLFQLMGHVFINSCLLCHSNFSYMFCPAEAIFRENTDIKEHLFDTRCQDVTDPPQSTYISLCNTNTTHLKRRYQHWYWCLFAKVNTKNTTCINMHFYCICALTPGTVILILLHLWTYMTFYNKNIFFYINILLEDGHCRPKYLW